MKEKMLVGTRKTQTPLGNPRDSVIGAPSQPRPCSQVRKVKLLGPVQLFAAPWTVGHQAPPSMGFSRQEYWSGLPCPSPGDLPDPGIEPGSPAL